MYLNVHIYFWSFICLIAHNFLGIHEILEDMGSYAVGCGSFVNASAEIAQFFWVRNIVCMVIPWVVISVCSAAVIVTIFRSTKKRQSEYTGRHHTPDAQVAYRDCMATKDHSYWHRLTLVPLWISNYMPSVLCAEISLPFPKSYSCIAEVWKLINNFITHIKMNVITYPCMDMLVCVCLGGGGGGGMTSSNRNSFRFTGPLCGEFTDHRWFPPT